MTDYIEQNDDLVGNEEIGEDGDGVIVIVDTAGGYEIGEIPHQEED